ncbi:MAG: carboxylesterase family protein [Muribaculaceae bacterium]|nr:carboxylesterase family protein [Muribaculaceae bacterium]
MKRQKSNILAAIFIVLLVNQVHAKDYDTECQQLYIGEGIAETDTEYGKVRGFKLRDIYQFRGIPYGADTGGKNRFMPPQPPEKWDGIRPAVAFGASSPQNFYDRRPESYSMFVDHWNYDEMNEDCLRLNIWTPSIDDGKKRPVLVWLHGGGFTQGNGIEQDGYDGENISRYGDIVFCSINHRLGAFGFTDLSSVGGEKYATSGNVGMLDIVAALKWVKGNIENFGGNPDNVTIMGQSGGGSKVCLLCSMPKARGLFNKAVALSGNALRANSREYSTKLGETVLDKAGLDKLEIDSLQRLSTSDFLTLSQKALSSIRDRESGWRGGYSPVADGISIPTGIFFSGKNKGMGSDVPMLLSSTFHEWNPNRDDPQFENLSFTEVSQKLEYEYGDKAKEVVDAYSKAFPEMRPIEIWSLIASNRINVVATANAKCNESSPVYMAWFGFESPLFNGRHRAFHCLDISFWFLNTDRMVTHTGGGGRPRKLSYKMADSLLAFMKTGNPNCDSLPEWKEYNPEEGSVMILNDECRATNDPDREARESLTRKQK